MMLATDIVDMTILNAQLMKPVPLNIRTMIPNESGLEVKWHRMVFSYNNLKTEQDLHNCTQDEVKKYADNPLITIYNVISHCRVLTTSLAKVVALRIFVTFYRGRRRGRKIMNDLIEGRRCGATEKAR